MVEDSSHVVDNLNSDELRKALTIVAGKWKLEILWLLHHRPHSFGELKRAIPIFIGYRSFSTSYLKPVFLRF